MLGPYAPRWELLGRSASRIAYGAKRTQSIKEASAAERTECEQIGNSIRATQDAVKCLYMQLEVQRFNANHNN